MAIPRWLRYAGLMGQGRPQIILAIFRCLQEHAIVREGLEKAGRDAAD